MFLKFIGSGSALNTSLGNNSAFIKEGKSMLLIDCGSTTFSRIQELNLLDGVKNLYVLITHRHPDHISSLGDLIFYANYIANIDISVLTPDDINVSKLLKFMGVDSSLYKIMKLQQNYLLKNDDFEIVINFIPVQHVKDLPSYGYILDYNRNRVFYSGDSKALPEKVLNEFCSKEIGYIYHDVCSYDYDGNPHMFIENLCDVISKDERDRVFCMHYDESFDKLKAIQLGFNLVNNIEE